MRFDWQTAAVILIVLGALLYLARIARGKLRALRGPGGDLTPGCSACGDDRPASRAPAPKVLVQLTRQQKPANKR
ncbi:MAG: hypothetical protein LC746_13870 [Acidobacteria bacterium]|nr:hypothetical protein [Acidobacteriota bacterium]